MQKFLEMDENTTLKDQMEEQVSGPVILIDKFNVNPEQVDRFLDVWKRNTTEFKKQPAFISTQLHRGIGKSSVFIIYAFWESVNDFKNAVYKILGQDMQSQFSKYPESIVVSLHLFKKVAVPGICVE